MKKKEKKNVRTKLATYLRSLPNEFTEFQNTIAIKLGCEPTYLNPIFKEFMDFGIITLVKKGKITTGYKRAKSTYRINREFLDFFYPEKGKQISKRESEFVHYYFFSGGSKYAVEKCMKINSNSYFAFLTKLKDKGILTDSVSDKPMKIHQPYLNVLIWSKSVSLGKAPMLELEKRWEVFDEPKVTTQGMLHTIDKWNSIITK